MDRKATETNVGISLTSGVLFVVTLPDADAVLQLLKEKKWIAYADHGAGWA